MSSYFSRLNSSERRFLVIVGLLFFFVINIFFVWPRFSDWNELQTRIRTARDTLALRERAIAQTPVLQKRMAELGGDRDVPPEDQATQFQTTVGAQAARSGVGIMSYLRLITRTNDSFFLEQMQTVQFQSGEKQLVDFLYNLGSSASIRVRGLNVRPDQSQQQLVGSVTLVASYRKRARPVPAPVPARAAVTRTNAPTASAPLRTIPATPNTPATPKTP